MQGLDAFNAVSRAAVGVATSLDTHIEQLMGQHGWADGGGGSGAGHVGMGADRRAGRAGVESARLGSAAAEASLFELPGFDGGKRSRSTAQGAYFWTHLAAHFVATAAAPAAAGRHAPRMTGPARAADWGRQIRSCSRPQRGAQHLQCSADVTHNLKLYRRLAVWRRGHRSAER